MRQVGFQRPSIRHPDMWSMLLYSANIINSVQNTPEHQCDSSTGTSTIILCTARSISCLEPATVRYETVTLLIFPSVLSRALTTKATFHSPRTALMSSTITTSPTFTFRLSVCHFGSMTSFGKTSRVQRLQNPATIFCRKSNLCLLVFRVLNSPCGIFDEALPRIRSFGQRYEPSSGVVGVEPIGRLVDKLSCFKHSRL